MPPPTLERRFLDRLRALGVGAEPAHLLVAVSGGCDSVTLLHLLRGAARALPLRLTVAHLDHAMRPESADDARWLAGLCQAWEFPLVSERLPSAPRSEAAARRERYRFLRRVAESTGADHVLTAHHADDQAETVLFRVLRGTGLRGLSGIPARTPSGVLRPLLAFRRAELEEYAIRMALAWRSDASNGELTIARNRLRHRLLPEAERVAPGARRSLLRLARLAREAEKALARQAKAAEAAVVREERGELLLARGALRDYDPAIASRVVRSVLRRFGVVPGRAGTRTALQFITDAAGGRELQLPRGVRILIEFDEARVRAGGPEDGGDAPVRLPEPLPRGAREAPLTVGGFAYRVSFRVGEWSGEEAPAGAMEALVPLDGAALPLELRGWRPGDRMRTAGGTKTLKRLFAEERVPRSRRHQLPVLADARGDVLWIGGVRRTSERVATPGAEVLFLTITNV